MEKTSKTIKGILEKIIYKNPENGFTVARVRSSEGGQVTIVGNTYDIKIGEKLEIEGNWIFNAKYGEQFEITGIKVSVPVSEAGIINYLSSGFIKGIGPVTAKKIVNHFGINVLGVLEENPSRLKEINGIGKKKVDIIIDSLNKHRKMREVMVFLHSYGISNTYSVKIYNNYGDRSVEILQSNPYRLSDDIFGIGFKIADQIAGKLGIKRDSIFRIKAGIIYLLRQSEDQGHCYYPYYDFVNYAENFLEVDREKIEAATAELSGEGKVTILDDEEFKKIYISNLYLTEKQVSEKIKKLTGSIDSYIHNRHRNENIKEIIDELSLRNNIILDSVQKKAILKAVSEKMIIITGSPGTGKSTILNFIIKIFETENKKVMLCAPTGRASKRLLETTGRDAKTIHRLLNYNPKLNKFLKNETNCLETDVLIIDESSMLDIRLVLCLLKALKEDSRVIFVGDIDQLPSVGPGNVLKDMINSKIIEVVELKKIYRQEGQSLIIQNAHKVRDGFFPSLQNSSDKDFFFIEKNDPRETVDTILNLISKKIPEKFNYDPLKDIQLLVPTNRGEVGVNNLNLKIQQVLNPNSQLVEGDLLRFKLNDRVIQLKNNYEKEVYNGDIGFITGIGQKAKEIVVNFDGKPVCYNYFELDELSLSYAISIHKSQGSEFKCIIIPLLTSHYMLLQRNLLYTAITRAKELAVLVGSKKAIGIAVNRNIIDKRYTRLKDLLIG